MRGFKYILVILFLFIEASVLFSAGRKEESSIRIIYSASLNGNLDGCRCKSNPRAGLVKRAAYLRQLMSESASKNHTILLDAGDILDVSTDILLSDAILKTYSELGYTAIAVGDQEFSNGIDKILEYRKLYPLISNNLSVCPNENRCVIFLLLPLIVKRSGISVGIFALLDPAVFTLYPKSVTDHIIISKPEVTAEGIVKLLAEKNTVLKILLYNGPYEHAENLAKRVPGIDIIIVVHEQRLTDLIRIGKTVLVSPGREGNRIGILDITVSKKGNVTYKNSFKLFSYKKDPDDKIVRARIGRYVRDMHSGLKSYSK
ncbi:MAG: hypothetical protein GXP33_02600 [Spirochaetes bacterium]|nr:hypothetical protein [Spirochaetota bacterium]